jgi:hypothetical protein
MYPPLAKSYLFWIKELVFSIHSKLDTDIAVICRLEYVLPRMANAYVGTLICACAGRPFEKESPTLMPIWKPPESFW